MSEMTPEKAVDLRKPFPKESIGKLPKGGVQLDYVGHAAVTDRLLSVDPNWSWEPFAIGPDGLPALDRANNLWIRLTICGVTRIGVGDGKSAKECIGDAIRNAAMRFGVALDLWAKEDLVEFAQAATSRQTLPYVLGEREGSVTVVGSQPTSDEPLLLDTKSKLAKAMYAGLNKVVDSDVGRLAFISEVIGREIATTKQLTEDDARRVLDHLPREANA